MKSLYYTILFNGFILKLISLGKIISKAADQLLFSIDGGNTEKDCDQKNGNIEYTQIDQKSIEQNLDLKTKLKAFYNTICNTIFIKGSLLRLNILGNSSSEISDNLQISKEGEQTPKARIQESELSGYPQMGQMNIERELDLNARMKTFYNTIYNTIFSKTSQLKQIALGKNTSKASGQFHISSEGAQTPKDRIQESQLSGYPQMGQIGIEQNLNLKIQKKTFYNRLCSTLMLTASILGLNAPGKNTFKTSGLLYASRAGKQTSHIHKVLKHSQMGHKGIGTILYLITKLNALNYSTFFWDFRPIRQIAQVDKKLTFSTKGSLYPFITPNLYD